MVFIDANYKKVNKILVIILFFNIFVAISKLIVGLIINSSSVIADSIHSMSDSTSNIIGIIAILFASKPKDKEHPYGHKKFETIASISIGIILLILGISLIKSSIGKFFNQAPLYITFDSLLVILLTLIINIFVSVYENKQGHKLNSSLLIADSLHTRSDIFISLGVLVSLISIKLGLPPIIDVITSFVVAFLIIYSSYEILKDNLSPLIDKNTIDETTILEVLKDFNGIHNVHNIRSRGFKDYVFIDMHIEVDSNLNVDEAHTLVHNIEDTISYKLNKKIDLIIHVEPIKGNLSNK